jgi:NDP-sugar pyrophosphorylase family protein
MTDVLDALARSDERPRAVLIAGGWLEIDTERDLAYARDRVRAAPGGLLEIAR